MARRSHSNGNLCFSNFGIDIYVLMIIDLFYDDLVSKILLFTYFKYTFKALHATFTY